MNSSVLTRLKKLYKSIWLFPAVVLLFLIIGTSLKLHGSSIGAYFPYFYGSTQKDPDLIFGKPRAVRSDEWLVATQKTIMQAENGFPRVNMNIANGEDVSLQDVPYKEWSTLLKPHNLVFFVLPLDYAFSFKWLLFGVLILLSCYFFVLALLPRKRLIAALLAISLLYSPFVQWWFAFGTIASIYYSLFIATIAIHLIRTRSRKNKLILSGVLSYAISCFAVVLYPPFQIASGLVAAFVVIGVLFESYRKNAKKELYLNLGMLSAAVLVAAAIVGAFILSRADVVKTITQTDYPGNRILYSGQVPEKHFFSSHLDFQLQFRSKADRYLIDDVNPTNQSEASNFILLAPYLLPLVGYLLFLDFRNKSLKKNAALVSLALLSLVFLAELFVKSFTPLSKIFLLQQVGAWRSLIGVGLLNIAMLTLIIRHETSKDKVKKLKVSNFASYTYSLIIFVTLVIIGFSVSTSSVGFISKSLVLLFSFIVASTIFLFLRKRYVLALAIYALFSVASSFAVNPIYRGLDVITDNPLSSAIKTVGSSSNDAWASDGGYLQHIAAVNGEKSLSGVHFYPQLDLWDDFPELQKSDYNRYAHTGIVLDSTEKDPIELELVTPDNFYIKVDPCSKFFSTEKVRYIVSTVALSDSLCINKIQTVSVPAQTFYIYQHSSTPSQ